MGHKKTAVMDGANIAYIEKTHGGAPKMANIVAVRSVLEENGYEPIIIVDASLIYEIDDRPQLEALIERQAVRQVPAETDADFFIIEMAEEFDALLISNDSFKPYQEDHPWIDKRRVPVMIVHGIVQLYVPKLEKNLNRID